MNSVEIQSMLFNQIRSQLPAHISMPEKISHLLDISIDSAYRRIRGEKELSFEELSELCSAFHISIDQLMNLGDGKVLFHGQFLSPGNFSFEDFLHQMLNNLEHINSFEEKQLIYQNKDISIFFYFMFPDLIAFKYYLWMKTHFQFPEFNDTTFTFDQISPENMLLINKILRVFMKIPTVEIMNPDNILTDLRQIEYFKVTKGFRSAEDLSRMYDSIEKMIVHIELIAKSGKKFLPGEHMIESSCTHKIFVHDFHFGDNEAVAVVGETKMTVLAHSAINFLVTNDDVFGAYSWDFMENIIRKSTLISISGEKARTRFFNLIRERIINFKSDKVKSLIH